MCGLIFIHRAEEKPAQKMVLKRYYKQKSRGQTGFGYISFGLNGQIKEWQRAKTEKEIEDVLSKDNEPNILFHHRQPTSTPNFLEATHPIKVSNELLTHDYFVIHNGIITNDEELKAKHEKLGFVYTTEIRQKYVTKEAVYTTHMFNDSEALAVEVALAIEDEKAGKINTKGSVAFIALQVDKSTQKVINIFFGRNFSNPLLLEDKKEFFTLTSEGKGEIVAANMLHKYDVDAKFFTHKKMDIGMSLYARDQYADAMDDTQGYYRGRAWHEYETGMGYNVRRNLGLGDQRDLELPAGQGNNKEFDDRHLNDELQSYLEENELQDDEDGFKYEPEDILIDLYEELEKTRDAIREAESAGYSEAIDGLTEKFTETLSHITAIEKALDDKDLIKDIREEVGIKQAEIFSEEDNDPAN